MSSACAAKGYILVRIRLVPNPEITARRRQLDKLDILHPLRGGRRHHAQHGDALPGLVGQLVRVHQAVVDDGGDFIVDAQLGEALCDGGEEGFGEGHGEVEEELVVCCNGPHDDFFGVDFIFLSLLPSFQLL